MHYDYYYTDIKGTPFRWKKSFITLIMTFCQFMCQLQLKVDWLSVCVSSSVGVALSRGHGKYFFRGNVSLDAGTAVYLHFFNNKNGYIHIWYVCFIKINFFDFEQALML